MDEVKPASNLLKVQIERLQEQLATLTEEKRQVDVQMVNFAFTKEKNFQTMKQNLIQVDIEIDACNSRIAKLKTEIERVIADSEGFYALSKAKFSEELSKMQQQNVKDELILAEQERLMKELMKEL